MKKIFNKTPQEIFQVLPHMYPYIRISPFSPRHWEEVLSMRAKASPAVYNPKFWLNGAKDILFFASGREALLACLKHLGLYSQNEVLIIKNTNGPYISSCVTKTIEKVCRWSQKLSPRTRLGLVIHEFGFPCPEEKILFYKKRGIPILEDCAYAMGSRLEGAKVGILGDYALYSLAKYYPMPLGGLLVSKVKLSSKAHNLSISSNLQKLILETLYHAQPFLKKWNKTRRENWSFFSQRLSSKGFKPYFPLPKKVVPGVYLTYVPKDFQGEKVKARLNTVGVESTQYYHQNGFYFPVHQFLIQYEREYILHFLLKNNLTK